MPEDAGKKKFIKDFLIRVQKGHGYIEDIWIDRIIRLPGAEGEGSTAQSLSGRKVGNITQMLEDDLQHCFDEGYFTLRFISAVIGSGKTSLMTYLYELTKTKPTYNNLSVVCNFKLSDLLPTGNNPSFHAKLYCYILANTFWGLLNNSSVNIRNKSKEILSDYLETSEVSLLTSAPRFMPFYARFSLYFNKIEMSFEELFFELIEEVSRIEPKFTFVYLIDDLDTLKSYPTELQQTVSLITSLIRIAFSRFSSRIRLFIYLVEMLRADARTSLINEDPIIRSLVGHWVINLNKGYKNELEMIRYKIDERIEGAFKGYQNFPQAWQEIKKIALNPSDQNLRRFCQEYAIEVLEIYEKYFKEAPEQRFEGNARELVEAECRQKWEPFLRQRSYTLSSVSTTTILADHAFDCYIELLHNSNCVARGFGEAKNYELLSSHLETFHQWLKDVGFNSSNNDGHPADLAFMIAPACPSLLQRKLELKNIHFIRSDKVIIQNNNVDEAKPKPSSVDINTADKHLIIEAFRGSRITGSKIDQLIANRKIKPYKNLDELVTELTLTKNARAILQAKIDENKICFLVE